MDRALIEKHLALAEKHIEVGTDHVERQRMLLREMARDGHPTEQAAQLLKTFEDLLAEHVADRERLRAELAAASFPRRDSH
ncbi:MAG: hypothetical protein JO055_10510 [Alphaproteobacteria bacterium]|nr:hypothetical protein [Alphaproteobacteria bacterium]